MQPGPCTAIPTVLTSFVGREHDGRNSSFTAILASGYPDGGRWVRQNPPRPARATEAGRQYADGVYWVELARLADLARSPKRWPKALQLVGRPGHPMVETLLDALHTRHLLWCWTTANTSGARVLNS